MSKNNEFASASLTMGQLNALVKKVGGPEIVLQILRGTIEVITKAISYIVATYTVMVDETLSVEEMVKLGDFVWNNFNINSTNFPKIINGQKSKKEVVLFCFNKVMTSEAVIAEMYKVGYKPANFWALIGLTIKNPSFQKKFPIIALGSVKMIKGIRHVPYVYEGDNLSHLELHLFGDDWVADSHFIAVCNK